jgi:Zn-dependent protease with chaperone function
LAAGGLLTLPLVLGIFIEKYCFLVERQLTLTGVLQLGYLAESLKTGLPSLLQSVRTGFLLCFYYLFDHYHQLRALWRSKPARGQREQPIVNRLIHAQALSDGFAGKLMKFRLRVRRIRRNQQRRYCYRFISHVLMIGLIFVFINGTATSKSGLSEETSVTLIEDSPRTGDISALATKAGVPPVAIRIAYVSQLTSEMNATGRYRIPFGPQILLFDTTVEGLKREELLFVVGHELYHVTRLSSSFVVGATLFACALIMLLCFGIPRRRREAKSLSPSAEGLPAHFTSTVPRYLCVGLAAWLLFQTVALALQRSDETAADRFAVSLTIPEFVSLDGARSALMKINRSGINDPSPPWLFQTLFNNHPSLSQRLKGLEDAVLTGD